MASTTVAQAQNASTLGAPFPLRRSSETARVLGYTPVGYKVKERVDFDALVAAAKRNRTCAECGADLHHRTSPRSVFCSDPCRYRFRDRRRLVEKPERDRERSRRYYAENREAVLARAAAKRALRPPRPRPERVCASPECGEMFVATRKDRQFCSRRCRDRAAYLRRRELKS